MSDGEFTYSEIEFEVTHNIIQLSELEACKYILTIFDNNIDKVIAGILYGKYKYTKEEIE